ncbi:MAG TPA: TonB-dependent receptor [Bacteroidales bacterium]|nr:TonB-dependent receptor [Bacteroidales bacterium]
MNSKILHIPVLFLLFLSLCITGQTLAQEGTIRGSIFEKETGEPIIFTNVYLYKTTYGAATDVNGMFVISRVPKGTYTLMVTYLGYDTLRMPIVIKGGEVINKKLYLKASTIALKGISITSTAHVESKTETRTSVVKITPRQVKQIPAIGGQPDLAQYLQVLPGVVFTGDQGGQLYIRGGSPIQNKVLLDGMIIYNPFHSIGLFSVFETDIIRNADIYTGGFGAEYGGRISSVMDIRTRDGNKKRIAGKIGASTFGANLLLEGPLKKQTESGDGSSSFIFSLKNSYLEQSAKIFYKNVDTSGLPFNYTDVYGKISFNSQNGSKVNFFGFNFTDNVNDYKALSDFNWTSSGGGVNFVVVPGKTPALMEGVFAYSKYKISMLESEGITTLNNRTSEISGFNGGLGFTYFLGKDEIKYGVEMLGFKTIYNYINTDNRKIEQLQNTTEIAGYVKYKWTKGKFLIEPSFRVQWYASLANLSPEPRIAVKYNATNNLRFKLAAGLYSQNLISANSDRDVVNLFYGFLSGSENLPETFDGKTVKHKLQKSDHLIIGAEYDGITNLTINLEGYYKYFPQLTNINRDKIFEDTPENAAIPDYLKKDYIIERGDAEGIDLSLKYEYSRLYLWAVYSYAFVHRTYERDHMVNYVPHYDRRHNINLVVSYQMGENKSWETSMRWNFGSGFPFTLTQGYYEKLDFNQGITSNYTTGNGSLGILYGELNGGRLSYYHRLDCSVKKTFVFSKNSKLEADLSVTNAYDRKNIFYINRITAEKIYQLPFMPSFGLNFIF